MRLLLASDLHYRLRQYNWLIQAAPGDPHHHHARAAHLESAVAQHVQAVTRDPFGDQRLAFGHPLLGEMPAHREHLVHVPVLHTPRPGQRLPCVPQAMHIPCP